MNQRPQTKFYNLSYVFDENLFEIPKDADSLNQFIEDSLDWIHEHIEQPESEWDIHNLVKCLGETSAYLKQARRLDEALEYIEMAMQIIEQHDLGFRQFVVQGIRWADIHRYRGEYGEALEIFESLEELTAQEPEVQNYQDFVFQHLGKFYFDIENYEKALSYFQKALEIREKIKDQDLIESTVLAIQVTKSRLSNSD